MKTPTVNELAKMIDHSLLHPTMSDAEVRAGCELSRDYAVATACVKPYSIHQALEIFSGTDVMACAVIGFLNESGQVEVAGVGVAPSRGLKNGVIINIDSTIQSIVKSIEDAELMAGCEVSNVYVNMSGLHMKGENSKGTLITSLMSLQ